MATIYAYSVNNISCNYSLYISRDGDTTTVRVIGTIYGNGTSLDSNNNLYAHLRYNVSPANTGNPTTYVESYGVPFGNGVRIVEAPLNGSSIPKSGVTFDKSWTIPNDGTITYENCALFLSKSPNNVETNSNEAYLFIGKKLKPNVEDKLRYYTENLSIEPDYTPCTAPTSVTASAGYVKPGDIVTISWSGAEAGLNNGIRKYQVYYKKDSLPSTIYNGYDGVIESTSTSVDITMSDARGSDYYFKVRTIGWAIGYSSTLSENYATCRINQLPPAPTVIPEKTIIPSGGGLIGFALSATDPDSQTTSFYYSTTTPGGEKTEISNGEQIEVKDETTYYFYSFDGLEYSESYTSQSITVNTKPTITSITTTGIGTLYTSDLLTNDRYKDSFYTQVNSTLELSKPAIDIDITWYARYATIPKSGSVSDWKTTIILGTNKNLNTNLDLSSNTEFKKLDNIVYQIGASYNDGIEDSDISWGDTNFVIAPVPTIGDFINQYGKTNVAYSTSNHFYHEASIIATKDSSVTSIDATINNNAQVTTSGIRGYLNDGYFKINIENTNKNTKYTLEFTINRVIGSVTKEFEIYSAGLPYKGSNGEATFGILDIYNQATLKAYSDTGDFTISLYNFFETLSYSSAKKNYDGTKLPTSCLSFDFVKDSKTLNIVPTYSDSSSDSILYFTYKKDFYKALAGSNPLELDLEAANSVDLKITFTDVFGQSYSVTKQGYLTLDFREPFINEDGFSISVLRNNNEVIDNIREGDKVKFILNWKSYNSQVATIESYIYRSSTIVDNPSNITSWERYQNNSNYIWNINTSEVIPTGLIRSGTSNKIYTVGQLNKSNYVYFKISTTINGQSRDYYTDGYRITQRHVSVSKAGFSSFNYDSDNQKISYVHTPYDSGGGNTPNNMNNTSGGIEKLEIGIQYSTDFNSESSEKKYISSTGGGSDNFVALITRSSPETIFDEESSIIEYTHSFQIENFSYYNIRLVFKTTIGSIEKIGYGEETTIYNITPTIAYRKNQLGINTIPENFEGNDGFNPGESIKDTSILIIQSATNRNNIYFITPNNRIKFNINDGKIDGILLDAGNWN